MWEERMKWFKNLHNNTYIAYKAFYEWSNNSHKGSEILLSRRNEKSVFIFNIYCVTKYCIKNKRPQGMLLLEMNQW